jgi:hypothetical protein
MGVGEDGAFADPGAFGQFPIGSAGSAGDLDLVPGGFGNCAWHGVIWAFTRNSRSAMFNVQKNVTPQNASPRQIFIILQPVTRCDSRLRCGRQRDRNARARGRVQSTVKDGPFATVHGGLRALLIFAFTFDHKPNQRRTGCRSEKLLKQD